MRLPKVLKQFMAQSAAWTALCYATVAVCRFILHWGFPYNYPFMPFLGLFADFREFFWKLFYFHSHEFFHQQPLMMYPATLAVCLKFFMLLPGSHEHPKFVIVRFLCVIFLTFLVMLLSVRKALIRRGLQPRAATAFLVVTWLCSFPFLFEVYQLNMEFVVWIALMIGLWAVWTDRPWIAGAFIGIAGAMKFFPFIFLGLLLVRKQYWQVILGPIVAALITVPCLWLVCPDVGYSYRQFNAAVAHFGPSYMLHLKPLESGFDHSLFCLIKRLFPTLPQPETLAHILIAYMLTVAIGGTILFFVRIWKLPAVNQILCLSIAAILLPPTSYEYTLLHLYAPFVLLAFVALEQDAKDSSTSLSRGLPLAFGLLAFVLSIQSEFIFHSNRFAGQLQSVALVALWAVALAYPFELGPPAGTPSAVAEEQPVSIG